MNDKQKQTPPPKPQEPLRKSDVPKPQPSQEHHANDHAPTVRDTLPPPPPRK